MARPRGAVTASCGATPQDQAAPSAPEKPGEVTPNASVSSNLGDPAR
jgi:hypothetical protein